MKIKQPLVSVIMPCYNGEKFIKEAIESVINQTYQYWELIIVDDGSTDNSKEVINRYLSDKRIHYIQHLKNKGVSTARNTGIKASKGEYIAFLDQDDLWLEEKLEKQIKIFTQGKNSEVGLVFSNILIREEGQACRSGQSRRYLPKNLPNASPKEISRKLFLHNFIPSITVIVKRECFDELGLLDEQITGGADDYEFWQRVSGQYGLVYLDEPLAIRREHEKNFSSPQRLFKDNILIIKKVLQNKPWLRDLKDKKLAFLHYNFGRYKQNEGNLRMAREHFVKSIRYNPWLFKNILAFILCNSGYFGNWILKTQNQLKSLRNID